MVRKSKRKGSTVLGTILTILFVLGLVTAFILWPNAMMIVFHIGLFAEHVEKLAATEDGDGSLLDHMALVYGAGM